MFTIEDFKNGLKNIYSDFEFKEDLDNDIMSFTISFPELEDSERYGFKFKISEIESLLSSISKESTFKDNYFYSKNEIEALVDYQGRSRMMLFRENMRERYNASSLDCNINVGSASQEYVLAYICTCADSNFQNRKNRFRRIIELEKISCFKDYCQYLRFTTIIINDNNNVFPIKKATSIFQSYLFNLAYNYDVVLVLANDNENEKVMRHRTSRQGQLFPYKTYKTELVKYYNQGLSSDIPLAQYLAFYHVAEYFFQSISEQDVFNEIENYITNPCFSPYDKDSIKDFYKKIKKKIQSQKDNDVWDERNGLLLCLKQFIPDINQLKNAISSLDASALNYYTSNDVPFADEGKAINFSLTAEEIYPLIRNRVYSVRNAIVHSKEGEKLRYEPFIHDKQLAKEIPLIRAIAEEIIINSAKPLKDLT